MIILLLFIIVSICLMYAALYLMYRDCSEDELKYIKKYFNSYNINKEKENER